MSSNLLTCTFNDGQKLHGRYSNTSDLASEYLLTDPNQVWRWSEPGAGPGPFECTCGAEPENCQVSEPYESWAGNACRACMVFLGPYSRYAADCIDRGHNWGPDWYGQACAHCDERRPHPE